MQSGFGTNGNYLQNAYGIARHNDTKSFAFRALLINFIRI